MELFGTIAGLIYIFFEIRQSRWMWITGVATSGAYIVVFTYARLYADAALQGYYLAVAVYGLYAWRKKGTDAPANAILYRLCGKKILAGAIAAVVVITFALYGALDGWTDSPIPLTDGFTTAVGIIATWLLAKRYLAHWYFWMLVNSVCVAVYIVRDLHLTAGLYVIYAALSVYGLYLWKRKGEEQVCN